MPHSNPNPNPGREIDLVAKQPGSGEGLYVNDLPEGTVVEIETQDSHYKLVKNADTHVCISGHPRFCPEPVEVEIEGSFPVGPAFSPNPGFIGRGMHMIFKHPTFDRVTTSRIREIRTRTTRRNNQSSVTL